MLKILDNNYYDLIINNIILSSYESSGDSVTLLNDTYSLVHVLRDVTDACDLNQNPYEALPTLFTLESTIAIEKSGIGTVQRDPEFGLFGQGVIIGIIDTGIDYQHQAFINPDRTSRILSMWDQTVQEGLPPEGFTFGTEYERSQINRALNSGDPLSVVPSTDTNGHGTAIASIATGNSNPVQSFTGVVPESDLVIVKLKEAKLNLKNTFFVPEDILCYQESDIMLGIRYLTAVAQRINHPLVICIALGSTQGGHDGYGPVSSYLDSIARLPGIGIAVSAGNEGNNGRHYFNNTLSEPFYNDFLLNIGNNDTLFSMEIWPYAPQRFTIEVSSPDIETTQIVFPSLYECQRFDFTNSQSVLWVNNLAFESGTGDPIILLRFENPLPGIWRFRVQNTENEPFSFHSWLPAGDMISDGTFFLDANPNTTITAPGNAMVPLTVAAYNQFDDTILSESGRGYTRNGLIKPDITAPGYEIACAIPGNLYGTITGTGAAAAHTAGAIAMILEWAYSQGNYSAITGIQISRMIIREAQHNPPYIYPNNVWGYGQLNVYNVLNLLSSVL